MGISIHAPREGSDGGVCHLVNPRVCISIHAPREGSDQHRSRQAVWRDVFQSTLPVRGATASQAEQSAQEAFQSTLPVRGATRLLPVVAQDG